MSGPKLQFFVLTPTGERRESAESEVIEEHSENPPTFRSKLGLPRAPEGNEYVNLYRYPDDPGRPGYFEERQPVSADDRALFANWLRSLGKNRSAPPIDELDQALQLVCGSCTAEIGIIPASQRAQPSDFPTKCPSCDASL